MTKGMKITIVVIEVSDHPPHYQFYCLFFYPLRARDTCLEIQGELCIPQNTKLLKSQPHTTFPLLRDGAARVIPKPDLYASVNSWLLAYISDRRTFTRLHPRSRPLMQPRSFLLHIRFGRGMGGLFVSPSWYIYAFHRFVLFANGSNACLVLTCGIAPKPSRIAVPAISEGMNEFLSNPEPGTPSHFILRNFHKDTARVGYPGVGHLALLDLLGHA